MPSTDTTILDDLHHIIENAPIGMAVSRFDGSFVYVNNALKNMLGYWGDEIYSSDVIVSHPDDYLLNRSIREQLSVDLSKPITVEKRYLHKKGHSILGLASCVCIENKATNTAHIITQIINITKHKKVEQSLNLFRSLINSSTEMMLIVDPVTQKVFDSNIYACQSLGYTYQELLSLKINNVDLEFSKEKKWDNLIAILRNTKSIVRTSTQKRKDDSIFPVEMSINHVIVDDVEYLLILSRDITERKKSEALILKQANYDSLTGLSNRNFFHQKIKKAIKKEKFFYMISLNLNNFKQVNDSLGHFIGDKILIEVGKRIVNTIGNKDNVARIDGDEFGILVYEKKIDDVIRNLIDTISEYFIVSNNKIFISCCLGLCFYPKDAGSVEDLFKNVDLALTHAKSKGRNRYEFFTQKMNQYVLERMQISQDLHVAVKQQQFIVQYQPIICMRTGSIKKAEALIRWQHPKLGLINPRDFIQVSEENGTIEEIGDWILEQAIRDVSFFRKNYQKDFQISINTSPLYFREGNEQLDNWHRLLKKANLSGSAISLEITENLLLDTGKHLTERLLMLRDAGIQVALDDFGTGYSSLAYLKKLDIDYLKIDKSFIENLHSGSQEEALCEAIIVMAHKLNLEVIAEGIETNEQGQFLKRIGCDYAQGYYFAKPLFKVDFINYLANK